MGERAVCVPLPQAGPTGMLALHQAQDPSDEAERAARLLQRGGKIARLVDLAATPKDALVKPHNPLDYAERLGFHRQAKSPEDYGA